VHAKTLCLGALTFQEGTGYDIKKLFETAFSHFQSAGYGSIYPALRQLEHEGLVSCRIEPGEKHPDRKLFRITPAGRAAFARELAATPAQEQLRSDFLALLFFAHLLPTEVLAAKLDQIEASYLSELDYLESLRAAGNQTAGIAYTIEQGIRVYGSKLELLRERRESLLASHRQVPASWSSVEALADDHGGAAS
jgi:DNA-binding PadR family transcriptional regulator